MPRGSRTEEDYFQKFAVKYNHHANVEPYADSISVSANPLVPVENDWQDYYKDIPTLANNLDVVIKNPGIFPTSELVKLNPQLFSFFGKLPAYS